MLQRLSDLIASPPPSPPEEQHLSASEAATRWWGRALIVAALLALPALVVSFPPVTDLPQHLAQIRLLFDGAGEVGSPYRVAWFAPNGLFYYLAIVVWSLLGPELSGPALTVIVVASWTWACFALARRTGGSWPSALLASLCVFSVPLYWGFFNFLVGWPVFVGFFLVAWGPLTLRRWFGMLAMSGLLWTAHALWFAVACICLALVALAERDRWLPTLMKMSAMLPIGIMSLFWFVQLRIEWTSGGLSQGPFWFTTPLQRMAPTKWIADGLVGAVSSSGGVFDLAAAVSMICLIWVVVAFGVWIRRTRGRGSWAFVLPGCVMGFVYAFGPSEYLNTIAFELRWLPLALAWFLCVLPPPVPLHPTIKAAVALAFVLMVAETTLAWRDFDQVDMSGLEDALAMVDPGDRVLGLDFRRLDNRFGTFAFMQVQAYAAAYRGATTNFSFASHASSLVRYREPPEHPWTPLIEWRAQTVQLRDFLYFDKALVNLPEEQHARFARQPWVRPMTTNGHWRAYEILHEQVRSQLELAPKPPP